MMFVPDYMFDTVYDIPENIFTDKSIKCLLVDIDNTLVPYDVPLPTQENIAWFKRIKSLGITILFVSNNHKERVEKYARGLDIPYIYDAGKPSVKKYRRIVKENGINISECAVVGDQIFTDALSAGRLGVVSIIVKPIKAVENNFFKFKRFFEKPFIKSYKRREQKKRKKDNE